MIFQTEREMFNKNVVERAIGWDKFQNGNLPPKVLARARELFRCLAATAVRSWNPWQLISDSATGVFVAVFRDSKHAADIPAPYWIFTVGPDTVTLESTLPKRAVGPKTVLDLPRTLQGKADKDDPLIDWVFKAVPLFAEEVFYTLL